METTNETKKPTQDELLKAVADVLDEALVEYEKLSKSAAPAAEPAPAAPAVEAVAAAPAPEVKLEKADDKMPEDKKKDKEDEEDDEDEEKLMQTYKSLVAKMEKKGIMNKVQKSEEKPAEQVEAKTEEVVQKSETPAEAPAPAADPVEGLRKSIDERFGTYDGRFEALTKAIQEVSETVKKFAAAPAARKGVTGLTPLRKSEAGEGETLNKNEVLGKLLDLKKSGDRRVTTDLIMRIETGRVNPADVQRIKGILG